jgi:hypothetical protein
MEADGHRKVELKTELSHPTDGIRKKGGFGHFFNYRDMFNLQKGKD